jgi:hypothetical protein
MTVHCYACGQKYSHLRGLAVHCHFYREAENWLARLKHTLKDNELEVSASTKQTRISPPLDTQDIHGSGVGEAALPEDTALEPP